jgi:excisionase family DNA binding protein
VPSAPSAADDLLKTTEVAKLLRVHPKHVYRLLNQGLPGRRVGSEWRFIREEVLAWSARRAPARDEQAVPVPRAESSEAAAPLLAANGDLVIEILLGLAVREGKPLVGFVQADRSTALDRLASREILAAGFHGERAPAELGSQRLARLHLVQREIGLAYAPGKKLANLAALAKKRLASRPPTAGVRGHLDRALAKAGLSLDRLRTKATEVGSHRDAVCAVVRGDADVALTTTAWAARVGLQVLPLGTEGYELLMYADTLGTRAAVGLCELAQGSAYRRALSEVAGYDASDAGSIRYVDR